jgi:hypothetical protein
VAITVPAWTMLGQIVGRALFISQQGELYVARQYAIYRSGDWGTSWQLDCWIPGQLWKRAVASSRLGRRLLRYDIVALGLLSDGIRVAVARDGLYLAEPGVKEMRRVFQITRGSRPLNIVVDDRNRILFGEYGDVSGEKERFIYISDNKGRSFHVGYTFSPGEIRHVHNVIYDQSNDVYWVLVGDFDGQPGIGVLSKDMSRLDWLVRGDQKARAVGAIVERDCIYYGTDSELTQNFIIRLDKKSGRQDVLQPIEGSSLYASKFGSIKLISTCVEPSLVNRSTVAVLYASVDGSNWSPIKSCQKDCWHPIYFQFGTLVLPTSHYSGARGMFSGQSVKDLDNRTELVAFTE